MLILKTNQKYTGQKPKEKKFTRIRPISTTSYPSQHVHRTRLTQIFEQQLRVQATNDGSLFRRCVSMNHGFKLKAGETCVTNDARLLNYAVKSGYEGVAKEQNGWPTVGKRGEGWEAGVRGRQQTRRSRTPPLLSSSSLLLPDAARCLTTPGPSNLRRSLFLTPLARVGHKREREKRKRGEKGRGVECELSPGLVRLR